MGYIGVHSMQSVRRWRDSDEPHASATDDPRCHRGTRASGPHVEAARRLGLRLPPVVNWVRGPPARMWKQHAIWGFGCRPLPLGYASLRPACGSSAPSGASAAACCHLGTRASGPHVEAACHLGLRLPPVVTGVRGPPARMWKRRAVWGFGCRLLSPGYAGLRPACGSSTPSGASVPPGYASLRPACGSGAPSGASAAACCHLGTRASGPHVRFTEGKPLSTPSTRHLARASHLPNFHLPRPFRSGRERGNEDGSALMTWASCHMIIEMRDQNPSVGVSAHY